MLTITKTFEFAYAHFLPEYKGRCKNLHGHTGILEVEVCRTKETERLCTYPGMIMDFGFLKEIVTQTILDKLDHQCLNDVLPIIPTAENMTEWAVEQLKTVLGESLLRVRIYETPTSYAEWRK